jgi:hypothetical protein
MNLEKLQKSEYKTELEGVVRRLESMRRNVENPTDATLAEFVQLRWGASMESFYEDLGVNPAQDTIQAMFTSPDPSVRWLVPELIRDALRLGLRKNPIWADIIAAEQNISQTQITVPFMNMSEATPKYTGEAETFAYGTLSYGSKTLKVRKMGRALRLPYEVLQYVSMNLTSVWLQDFGVKLNHGIDALMIDVLLNGEQDNGSESAAVVGVETAATLTYKDILYVWLRMGRLGRTPVGMIGGEAAALETLDLPEFKNRQNAGPTYKNLDVKSPIPQGSNFYIHGSMPANQTLIIDNSSSIIKYNAQPLLIESDRMIQNQTVDTVASLTTGFGILYRDGRVILDDSIAVASNDFPTWMDVDPLEQVSFDR